MSPEFHQRAPDPRLEPYVEAYHQAESPPGARIEQRIVPRGRGAIVFTLRGRYQGSIGQAPFVDVPPGIVHGQFTRWATNRFEDGHLGFLVMLTPVGWHGLTGMPAEELTDTFIDLRRGAPECTRPLTGLMIDVVEADTFSARCDAADAVLLEMLGDRACNPFVCEGVAEAARRIEAERGVVGICDLATVLATTQRTMRRNFDRAVGISPKTYASIIRVNQMIAALHHEPPESWQDFVERFGYADQSHLGREFRRFTGLSPTAYLPDEHPLERSFSEFV